MTRAPRRPRDTNQLAKLIVDLSTGEKSEGSPDERKDPAAVQRGRKGGVTGGKKRMGAMTPEERKALGLKAARARWAKRSR